MELILVRDLATDQETTGKLYVDGEFFGYTLEDTIRIKKEYGDTCIPFRRDYKVKITWSPAFKRDLPLVWTNDKDFTVQNRNGDTWAGIRFHGGNHHMHTLGCILIARNRVSTPVVMDYKGTKYTFNHTINGSLIDSLMNLIKTKTVKLSIVHALDFKDGRIVTDRNQPVFMVQDVPLADDNVCAIQNALNLNGIFTPYAVFDEAFAANVAEFQKQKGIEVDGKVGKGTAAAMGLQWNGYELVQKFDYVKNKTV